MAELDLLDSLSAFAGRRVVVVGDVMLDEYLWGEVFRLSPEAPVPVVEVRSRTEVAGGAGNVAANLVSLGGTPVLCGAVGRDPAAERLAAALRRGGVGAEGLVPAGDRPTTVKARLIANGQQVVRIDDEGRGPLPADAEEALLRAVDRHVPEADACVLSDYGKGVVTPRVAGRVLDRARRAGRWWSTQKGPTTASTGARRWSSRTCTRSRRCCAGRSATPPAWTRRAAA